MIISNLKYAWRNLMHQKTYTVINILGLSLGITCSIVIFSVVNFSLSYEKFNPNFSKTYRITTELHQDVQKQITGVPYPLTNAFGNDFDFATNITQVFTARKQVISVKKQNTLLKFEEDVAFTDAEFFNIFNFPIIMGNSRFPLKEYNTAIITQDIAKKYFKGVDPIGQIIRLENKLDLTITGVMKNPPHNTDRKEQVYVSFESLKELQPWQVKKDHWTSVNDDMQCFIVLKEKTPPEIVDQSLIQLTERYYDAEDLKTWQFKLQPLSDIHFNMELGGKISKQNIMILSVIGIFLIVTACVNFINLATAQAVKRTKEIGIKKTLGINRKQIFWQFITETAILCLVSLLISIGLLFILMPYLSSFFHLSIGNLQFTDVWFIMFIPALLLVIVFFSGSYPAIILTRFKPIIAIKANYPSSNSNFSLRKSLVLVQFVIALLLILGTLVIFDQIRYSLKKDMGFNSKALIVVPIPDNQNTTIERLRNRLAQVAGIEESTFFYEAPLSEDANNTGIRYENRKEDEKFTVSYRVSDEQYTKVFGLNILAGRNLSPSDTSREFLVNESTVNSLGLKSNAEIIEKTVFINGDKGKVVGVIQDFHNKSLHSQISPLVITSANIWYFNFAIKVNTKDIHNVLRDVETLWTETFPNNIFKYNFFDEKIKEAYSQERQYLDIITVFSCIAILIGCLGLFGLISFLSAQKTKEIGIRKVLGARIEGILWIFGREFLILIILAIAIAGPIAWWTMNRWLESFAYRIHIGFHIYFTAVAIILVITIATVGLKSYRAARINPLKSLRTE